VAQSGVFAWNGPAPILYHFYVLQTEIAMAQFVSGIELNEMAESTQDEEIWKS
jgi:hypothetical protein